jgi:hypothetical protein
VVSYNNINLASTDFGSCTHKGDAGGSSKQVDGQRRTDTQLSIVIKFDLINLISFMKYIRAMCMHLEYYSERSLLLQTRGVDKKRKI